MLTPEEFRQNFRGLPVPHLLNDLFSFQNKLGQTRYSATFELWKDLDAIFPTYFEKSTIWQTHCFPFGYDGNSSVYALWKYDDRSLEESPIVYVSGDGEGNRVLANTLKEFFLILAYDADPIAGVYPDGPIEHTPGNMAFREWLQREYGLSEIPMPNIISQYACTCHPDFEQWIEKNRVE